MHQILLFHFKLSLKWKQKCQLLELVVLGQRLEWTKVRTQKNLTFVLLLFLYVLLIRVNFTKSSLTSLTMQQQDYSLTIKKLFQDLHLEKVAICFNSPIGFQISANLVCRLYSLLGSILNFHGTLNCTKPSSYCAKPTPTL